MATIKHLSSKNSNYAAAESYLTFQHNEYTGLPILDGNGRPKLRDSYLLDTLECGESSFAMACLIANRKYGKNGGREDVKTHHYIISFDPKDVVENGLTMEWAQALGLQFCKDNFPGHPAIVCTHPDVTCVLGAGMVIDLDHLAGEMDAIEQRGIRVGPENLKLSDKATISMPWHKVQDGLEEDRLARKGTAFGSTRRGIAYAYSDKYRKKTLRLGDLLHLNEKRVQDRLHMILESKNLELAGCYHQEPMSYDALLEWCRMQAGQFSPYICDAGAFLQQAHDSGKRIVLEAQLGAMRDIDYGIFPFTSSSNTLAAYAPLGAGIPNCKLDHVVGVLKAYSTCVGAGPFAAENAMSESWNEQLRKAGGEYGAATGRPRRVGPFDCVASRYGLACQGADKIALTKLDVLSSMKEIPVITGYTLDGVQVPSFDPLSDLDRVEPVVTMLPGWQKDISGCKSWDELPKEAKAYVEFCLLYTSAAGDAGQNGADGSGGVDLAVDLEHNVHAADFLDVLLLHAVQPQHLGKALLLSQLAGLDGGSVVAAALGEAGQAGGGTDILVFHVDLHGVDALGVVGAGGSADDTEDILMAGMDAQTHIRSEDEGTDIQGGAVGVGDPVLLHFHQSLHGLDKILLGNGRNAQTVGRVLQTLGVAIGPEELDGVVHRAIGLHALEDLLGVVQDHAGGIHLEGLIGDDAGIVPALALGVVHQEHMIREVLAKAQLALVGGFGLGGCGSGDLNIQHYNTRSLVIV